MTNSADPTRILVGTAGWSIASQAKSEFPSDGTHLARYSRVLNCAEINSSFYREHKPETYVKWAGSVPEGFRFSVKLSRRFTQEGRLQETGGLAETLEGISGLGKKWGMLLVQLPPSLEFAWRDAKRFISELKRLSPAPIAWEPRHLSWASDRAEALLAEHGIIRVDADPERCPRSKAPSDLTGSDRYFRLHGSPEIYKSKYSSETIRSIAEELSASATRGHAAWCIFDNTTFGHATTDALELFEIIQTRKNRVTSAA